AQDRITNGDAMLLPGTAKIYYEGDFIGETYINRISPREEFKLGAREEHQIKVEKKLLEREKEKAGFIKGKRNIIYKYQIELTNYRKDKSPLIIKDVIPYSRSEVIKVKWLNCSHEPKEDNLGIYTWELAVKPDEKVTIVYDYEVTWEKDYQITPSLP
ncbi:DUF4139 domain-containing protein, partial [Candidatus Heimdallarchaeota archaeon]